MDNYKIVKRTLEMASQIGPLAVCTCNSPIIKWDQDICGHCQINKALEALPGIITDPTKASVMFLLESWRIKTEIETEAPLFKLRGVNLALTLLDFCKLVGLTDEDAEQILGFANYQDATERGYYVTQQGWEAAGASFAAELEEWWTSAEFVPKLSGGKEE